MTTSSPPGTSSRARSERNSRQSDADRAASASRAGPSSSRFAYTRPGSTGGTSLSQCRVIELHPSRSRPSGNSGPYRVRPTVIARSDLDPRIVDALLAELLAWVPPAGATYGPFIAFEASYFERFFAMLTELAGDP